MIRHYITMHDMADIALALAVIMAVLTYIVIGLHIGRHWR